MHDYKILDAKMDDGDYSVSICLSTNLMNALAKNGGTRASHNSLITEMLAAAKLAADQVLDRWEPQRVQENQETVMKEVLQKQELKESHIHEDDIFKVRERIPNNVVDVADLKIQGAGKENALIRCPFCGQAHAALISIGTGWFAMSRDFKANEMKFVGKEMLAEDIYTVQLKPDTDVKLFFEDWQSFLKHSSDQNILVENETEILCPQCFKMAEFFSWKKAFANPLEFFETENLCDICGGECVEVKAKKTKGNENTHVYKCETCGHEKESKDGSSN